MSKHAVLMRFLVPTFALMACASGEPADEPADEQDLLEGRIRPELVGSFADESQRTEDFGLLVLKADGTYAAKVLNAIAAPDVVCNRAPCNVSEAGTWTALTSRLRIAPQGGAVRIYRLTSPFDGRTLRIRRAGSEQAMHLVASVPLEASPANPAPSVAFAVRDAVVLEDETLDEQGGSVPRARIILSNIADVCNRIDERLNVTPDETDVSLWTDAAAFRVGKQTIDHGAANAHAGAGFVSGKATCNASSSGAPDRGAGSYEISEVGATVKGKLDVTFAAGHVVTTFEAKACPKKKTHGIVTCAEEKGTSTSK